MTWYTARHVIGYAIDYESYDFKNNLTFLDERCSSLGYSTALPWRYFFRQFSREQGCILFHFQDIVVMGKKMQGLGEKIPNRRKNLRAKNAKMGKEEVCQSQKRVPYPPN